MKFTPAAATSTRTSPGLGVGASTSAASRTSGPPFSRTSTACIFSVMITRLYSPISTRRPSCGVSAGHSMVGDMAGVGRFSLVALDCPDPQALAAFYGALAGFELDYDGGEWVQLR